MICKHYRHEDHETVGKIETGRDDRAMAFTPDGKYLAVSNVSDDTVEFIKSGETDSEFVLGVPKSPQRLVAVPDKKIMFSLGRVDNVVSMLDKGRPKSLAGLWAQYR